MFNVVCRKCLSSPRCRSELIDSAWVVIRPWTKMHKKLKNPPTIPYLVRGLGRTGIVVAIDGNSWWNTAWWSQQHLRRAEIPQPPLWMMALALPVAVTRSIYSSVELVAVCWFDRSDGKSLILSSSSDCIFGFLTSDLRFRNTPLLSNWWFFSSSKFFPTFLLVMPW